MKNHPILFSAPMVRAILDGSKTQTRRAIKPQPRVLAGELLCWRDDAMTNEELVVRCPYGAPGDRLWVRETWAPLTTGYAYRADTIWNAPPADRWRPSIHMPRLASRITLQITGVRVQRLQEISESDAISEGIGESGYQDVFGGNAVAHYHRLWNVINGIGSWEENPWVWVVEFKRVTA